MAPKMRENGWRNFCNSCNVTYLLKLISCKASAISRNHPKALYHVWKQHFVQPFHIYCLWACPHEVCGNHFDTTLSFMSFLQTTIHTCLEISYKSILDMAWAKMLFKFTFVGDLFRIATFIQWYWRANFKYIWRGKIQGVLIRVLFSILWKWMKR